MGFFSRTVISLKKGSFCIFRIKKGAFGPIHGNLKEIHDSNLLHLAFFFLFFFYNGLKKFTNGNFLVRFFFK